MRFVRVAVARSIKNVVRMDNTNEKIEAFKVELKALMQKHGIGIYASDQYIDDDYCGADHYLTIDDEPCMDETVAELFDRLHKIAHKDLRAASPKVFIINIKG